MGELPFFSTIILLLRDFDYWPLNRGYHLVKVQPLGLSKTWDTYDFLGIHNADLSAPKRFVHKPSLGKLIEQ